MKSSCMLFIGGLMVAIAGCLKTLRGTTFSCIYYRRRLHDQACLVIYLSTFKISSSGGVWPAQKDRPQGSSSCRVDSKHGPQIILKDIKYSQFFFVQVLLGFILPTALLSMWISNTASTAMMVNGSIRYSPFDWKSSSTDSHIGGSRCWARTRTQALENNFSLNL